MESKAAVSLQGTPVPLAPLSTQENGGGALPHVEEEDPVSGGGDDDDGFETASDLDEEDSAAVERNLSPRKPVAQRTGVDVAGRDKNPTVVAENPRLARENPNLEESSKGEILGVEEKGPSEDSVGRGFSVEEILTAGESDEAGPENVEENGVPDARDGKDENLGDGDSEAAASPVVVGEVVSKPSEVKFDAVGVENNRSPDPHDGKDEDLDEATGPAIDGAAVSKPLELASDDAGAAAVGGESNVLVAQDEHNENLGAVGSEEVTSPVVKGTSDSKAFNEESVAVEVGKDEAGDNACSNQDIDGATKSNAVEGEKFGSVDRTAPIQTFEGEAESEHIEAESSAVAAEEKESVDVAGSDLILEAANAPFTETESVTVNSGNAEAYEDKLDSGYGIEANVAVGSAEKDEGLIGGSVSVDSEITMDSAEKAVPESGESIPVQESESSSILVVVSKSKDAETELVEESVGAYAAAASTDDDEKMGLGKSGEEAKGLVSDASARNAISQSSKTAKQIINESDEGSSSNSSHSGLERLHEHSHHIDGQIVMDSDEVVDSDEEEGEGRELFDPVALTALLKAATGASHNEGITITSHDVTRMFSADRPAGLGSSVPALRPAPARSSRPSSSTPSNVVVAGESENNMDEEEKKLQEKVEKIRVKFLRLVRRLGHAPEDSVAAQVLYRIGLAEGIRRGRQISRAFSIEHAKKKALQLEEEMRDDLDFSCNILLLGKTGVGKSATINSIFGEGKSHTSAFKPATTSVKEVSGIVDGVRIRVIDTPGLRASVKDQAANRKILLSIKNYTKRCPPDIVLYVDRLDTQTRDFNDLHLLRSITSALDSSIWYNAIIALSHAASAPPDGPNGSPLSYEMFIAQRSHVVQQSIRQAAGDMRLMNPVALVENHPSCRRNREGERVLPNGSSWRSQLLLLCYSSKILSEANSLLKLQDPSPGRLFGFRLRSPPLPFLLSSLLQSREHPKLSTDQGGENADSDIDLDDFSDTDQEEEEDEYDQLPPFNPLRKAQIAKLTKEQRRAYFDEYDYRIKLLQKKQWNGEIRRLKEMKKRGKIQRDDFAYGDDMAEDSDQDGAPAAVPVPLPDMVLPPSFDSENPVYRYRFLEPTSQLLTRPVFDSRGWDHDCGYDGVSIEENLSIAGRFPAGASVQITKDKKEFNIHLDSSISAKHGDNGSTLAGFDIQSIGKQLAYILRSETKFKNLKKNKTAAGISVTFLGETVATGLKIEDQMSLGKSVSLVASTGAVRAQGDVAYGANLEARLREKDYPIGQALSTLGLSLLRWRGDLALGANLQSQFSIGRNSKIAVRVGLNNKLSGQITVRTSTSEQLQIAFLGVLPLAVSIFRSIFPGESDMVH